MGKEMYTDFDLKTFVDKNTPKKHKTLKHDKTLNITNENSNQKKSSSFKMVSLLDVIYSDLKTLS